MQVTLIDKTNLEAFSSLLYEGDRARIAAGEPMIALGLCDSDDDSPGVPVGVLAGEFTEEDVFFITNLYVVPGLRRCGGGKLLLNTLRDALPGGVSFETEIYEDEDGEGVSFLEATGFEMIDADDGLYSVGLNEACLVLEPLMKKGVKAAKAFCEFSSKEIRSAGNYAVQKNLPMPIGGFLSSEIDTDLSSLSFSNGTLNGYIIVDKAQGGQPTISGLYTDKNPLTIGELLMGTMNRMKSRFGEDTVIMIPTISTSGENILKRKFPMVKKVSTRYCLYR